VRCASLIREHRFLCKTCCRIGVNRSCCLTHWLRSSCYRFRCASHICSSFGCVLFSIGFDTAACWLTRSERFDSDINRRPSLPRAREHILSALRSCNIDLKSVSIIFDRTPAPWRFAVRARTSAAELIHDENDWWSPRRDSILFRIIALK
jgi:hypothetical protein